MKTIKAILLDLDGTLLSSDLSVSPENGRVLSEVLQNDIRVFLASGRPSQAIAKFVNLFSLDTIVLASNGGCVVDVNNHEVIFAFEMSGELVHRVVEIAFTCGASPCVYSPTEWYVARIDSNVEIEMKRSGLTPKVVDLYSLTLPLIKVLIVGDNAALECCEKQIASNNEGLKYFYTYPEYLEVMPTNVSKGRARDAMLDYLGILPESVLAIGDGVNDLELLEGVGVSVAMSNAHESIKRMSDYTTLSNNDHGVAVAIRALVLNDRSAFRKLLPKIA